jgi:hypothetical protein
MAEGHVTIRDLVGKYKWASGIEAFTVAVVAGRSVEDVVRVYGGDPAAPHGELAFAEVDRHLRALYGSASIEELVGHLCALYYDESTFGRGLQVLEGNEWVAAIENGGYSGSFPEIARRCSAGGRSFFSVHWDIHASGMVTQAVDGVITARFESLYPVTPELRGNDRRPAWAIGPDVDVEDVWPTCLAQLEQQAGVVIEESWLHCPLPTFRIPDPYSFYTIPGAEHP